MKKAVLFSAMGMLAAATGTNAAAEEIGRVISSTPMVQQVAVPRQVCSVQPMAMQQPNSGAGAVLGAIAGGAMGNAIGGGSGRAAATIIGLVGGAAVGNSIEGSGSYVQNVQHCSTQTSYENRTVGYNVAYEYAGKQHNVQMPYDPGATIRLDLTPVGSNTVGGNTLAPAPSEAPTSSGPPGTPVGVIVGTPAPTVYSTTSYYPTHPTYPAYAYPAYPAYPAYYARPYYPPVGVSLNFGYVRGHRHHHRHHR